MNRKTILLVDDSPTILMMEKFALAKCGYELLTAANGEEAIEWALARCPDLILLDVVMPKMGGLEACRRLRALPETAHIPILMVTTRGEPENVEAGWESGCNDYVTKPIDTMELLLKVRSLLDVSQEESA